MPILVRAAEPGEAGLVLQFIHELADYERLGREVAAGEADIEALLFAQHPRAFCDIALLDGQPVGFALWFYNLSSFLGRHGLYLEDLFVRPQARGRGVGRALLSHLAKRCLAEGLGRMDWAVLDWNAPAQAFYDSLGAGTQSEWLTRRLTGEALGRLAEG
ncbi:MAG TPA: GNAT family N-acetyltransferase [Caulobacteraceae bacterium]|jgi:GNAT superfamily N-acetyltransferase|nr:GNAT family N-acetyltransferase [Caulobacteraceae bacterium]